MNELLRIGWSTTRNSLAHYTLTLLALLLFVSSGFAQETTTTTEPTSTKVVYGTAATYSTLPTVSSDKDDYAPGETAIITGTGWTLDSLVDIHLEEEPAHDHHHGYHDTKVNADGTWEIRYPIEERHLGTKFTVVVDGQQTGYQGLAYFTDGFVRVRSDSPDVSFYVSYKVTNTSNCSGDAITQADTHENPSSRNNVLINDSGGDGTTLYNVSPGDKNTPTQYIQITAASTSVQGGNFISWTGPNGFVSNSPTICISGTTPTRLYTANYASCTTPTATISSSDADDTICEGNSVTFTAGAITGATYEFFVNGTSTGAASTNNAYTTTSLTNGLTVTVQVTNGGCSATSAGITTTVNPNPATPTISTTTSTIVCPSSSVVLTSSATTGNQWYRNDVLISMANGQTYTATESGSYTVIVTENGCSSAASEPITVTVEDTQAPNAPATFEAATGECAVTVVAPTVEDNCAGTITGTTTDPLTYTEQGEYEITFTFNDGNGNTSTTTQQVIVNDVTAPVLTAAANQDVNLGTECSIVVPDVTGSAIDNCAGTTITQAPVAGTVVTAVDGQTINVVVTATDAAGNTDEATVVLTAQDVTAPVLTAAANQDVNLGTECSIVVPDVTGSAIDNCAGTTITQAPVAGTVVTAVDGQTINVVVTATDAAGNTDEATVVLTAQDVTAPAIACPEDQTRPNNSGTCTYTAVGNEFDPTYDDNCGVESITNDYNNSATLAGAVFEEGETEVTWTVKDAAGNESTCSLTVTVTNEAPVINSITGPAGPVQVRTGVTLTANFTDTNLESATWRLITNDAVVNEYSCKNCIEGNTISGSLNPEPGVYIVELEVSDACGITHKLQYEYVVIYDPNGGFVTGGGWIESPANAMLSGVSGRANFGFNAKYKNGKTNTAEVDGHTNFQFKAGNLHFSSFEHEDMSLVISGKKATYTGYGTVNGSGVHRFRVIAIDGDANGGSGPDQFRIKIWGNGSNSDEDVLYDNHRGIAESSDLATVLGGGSIVIHKPTTKTTTTATTKRVIEEPTTVSEISTVTAYPNPLKQQLFVELPEMEEQQVALTIYTLDGRVITQKKVQTSGPAMRVELEEHFDQWSAGIYLLKVEAKGQQKVIRLVK
ncbi:T9SS type A sorting domain-containing protein [Cesiribacter sp. SM1]|uniref:Ig-like domain-containing protein n=1 Tax=Cesiribacter sp. SM1 TaxID=2861196 RepID=UPI001CD26478|nr:T9SS type A sorting domain-containing protein [Cesiribacter sp. SM1]